ncbi:MAG: PIN domain-containing protein [Acidimicrobiales bacterium]
MASVIVLDASVLIAYLDADDAAHAKAEQLLANEVDDNFAASTVTLAEVLVAPARYGRLSQAQAALSDLEVAELTFPPDSAVRLARLRVSTGLKMPDCCVLLAAQSTGARVGSFDAALLRAARQLGIAVAGG